MTGPNMATTLAFLNLGNWEIIIILALGLLIVAVLALVGFCIARNWPRQARRRPGGFSAVSAQPTMVGVPHLAARIVPGSPGDAHRTQFTTSSFVRTTDSIVRVEMTYKSSASASTPLRMRMRAALPAA